jgi:hypothetical protein
MHLLALPFALILIFLVLIDAFESIIQPRRVTRRYRWTRIYYVSVWRVWRVAACWMGQGKRQTGFLALFGPLSLLGVFASWVLGLIVGFAILDWSVGEMIHSPDSAVTFSTYLYLSGTTFFTLGYGDVTPATAIGRVLAVGESGLGFGFLACIISYLPVLFQAYSRRESSIGLLDARAGSPPTAGELLVRLARSGNLSRIDPFLAEWEKWSVDILESQLSFPVLGYYRSQHDNQSWLAALTAIMDSCAFLIVQVKGINSYQAQVTFAMSRHAAVDLGLVLRTSVTVGDEDRLPSEQLKWLRGQLLEAGIELNEEKQAEEKLRELRRMYEPFVQALSMRLLLTLPPFVQQKQTPDNWQRSAWMRPAPGIGKLPSAGGDEGHFA